MPTFPSSPRLTDPSRWQTDAFDQLDRGQQLVIWTIRAIALGFGDGPALQHMLAMAFGSGAEDVFQSFLVIVRTLGGCARRRLRLHAPGCLRISSDEQAMLALFTAAQRAQTGGDDGEVKAQLDGLIEPPAHPALML